MRVLIIGGTRFIGPAVVKILLQRGHEVTVFHRGETEDERTAKVKHIYGDRNQLPSFKKEFEKVKPDIVLDMLLFGGPNAEAVVNTFRGMVGRVVAISSMDVYLGYGRLWRTEPGPIVPTPFTEDSPLRETDQPHGENLDNASMERTLTGQSDIPVTILRLPMVYGPHDRQHRLFDSLKRMDDNRPFILIDEKRAEWLWTRGYVENIAAGIALAVTDDRAAGKTFNVGEKNTLTEAEWMRSIARHVGWDGEIVKMPFDRLPEHLRADYEFGQHMECDTARIRGKLGYREPVPYDEGLRRTIEWERANPPDSINADDFDYEKEDKALKEFSKNQTRHE